MAGKPQLYKEDPAVRFMAKVNKTDTCWLWTGYISPRGYARFQASKVEGWQAHRWIWEQFHGPVPEGLVLDHLCRVRHCVNPDHLEPVTSGENTRRGRNARMAERTHCPNGHEWTDVNIRITPGGTTECRACRTEKARQYRHRIKENQTINPTWMAGYRAGYEAAMRQVSKEN